MKELTGWDAYLTCVGLGHTNTDDTVILMQFTSITNLENQCNFNITPANAVWARDQLNAILDEYNRRN